LDSAVFAAAVAAISVTRTGAQPSMPSMAEVEKFLKTNRSELRLKLHNDSSLFDLPGYDHRIFRIGP